MRLVAVAAAVVWVLALPAIARAAPVPYTSAAWPGCTGGYNSGGHDAAGRVYVPCGSPTTIGIYSRTGLLTQTVALDRFASDVEPTADGSYIYVAGYGAPTRLARTPNGDYALDPSWAPQRYPMGGTTWPAAGLFIETDAAGNVYIADGFWAASGNHTVVKYTPAGQFVTRFAQFRQYSWALGDTYWALGGIAVSPDGSRVLTTETGNNRLQVWTRGAGGAYTPQRTFGGTQANNGDRQGYCNFAGWQGHFAAPYDVGLDEAGNVYVVNTTCKQVLRFTPDLTELTANLDARFADGRDVRPHGFAVGADGEVFVGENQRVFKPTTRPAPIAAPPAGPVGPPSPTPPPASSTSPLPVPTSSSPPPAVRAPEASAGTPSAPPPAGAIAPVAPALADTPRVLTARGGVRRPFLVGPTRARRLLTTLRCSQACAARVSVVWNRRVVGSVTVRARPGVVRQFSIPLAATRRAGAVTLLTQATGPAQARITTRRTLRLGS